MVVRNTKEDGVWGTEEREQPTFPFVRGQEFKVIIFSDPEKFQVGTNRTEYGMECYLCRDCFELKSDFAFLEALQYYCNIVSS